MRTKGHGHIYSTVSIRKGKVITGGLCIVAMYLMGFCMQYLAST